MRLILVVGTRPQLLKAAVLAKEAQNWDDIELRIVDTGQHFMFEMDDIFRDELKLITDQTLNVKSDGPNQVSKIINRLNVIYKDHSFDYVLTTGDTHSTLGATVSIV